MSLLTWSGCNSELEQEGIILDGDVLEGYFSNFCLRFYLLSEGNKREQEYTGFWPLWLWFYEKKRELFLWGEERVALQHRVAKDDLVLLSEIRDWLSSLLSFNVSGKVEQGTKPLSKSWAFWCFTVQQKFLLFLLLTLHLMLLRECLVLG